MMSYNIVDLIALCLESFSRDTWGYGTGCLFLARNLAIRCLLSTNNALWDDLVMTSAVEAVRLYRCLDGAVQSLLETR